MLLDACLLMSCLSESSTAFEVITMPFICRMAQATLIQTIVSPVGSTAIAIWRKADLASVGLSNPLPSSLEMWAAAWCKQQNLRSSKLADSSKTQQHFGAYIPTDSDPAHASTIHVNVSDM